MRKKGFKKFVASILAGITIASTVLMCGTSSITAYADSNSRRQNLMDFAKGKSITDVSSINDLTYEDLRMLGLFLSNYYVPWSTGVGESYDDDSVKEQMTDALVDSCSFDKDLASTLVESIFSMSQSTAKPLSIANGTVDGKLTKPTSITKTGNELTDNTNGDAIKYTRDNCPDATLYTFWGCMTGGFDSSEDGGGKFVESSYADKQSAGDRPANGDERFFMYWKDDSGVDHNVWEMDKGTSDKDDIEFTPCTASYLIMMDNANYGEGLAGNSLLSVSEKVFKTLNEEQKDCTEMWNAQMYVDCFGNIICDVGTQAYVVVPACNNPYAWYSTSGGVSTAGDYMQLLNFFNIGEIKAGHITTSETDFTEEDNIYKVFKNGAGSFSYLFYSGDQSLYNLKNFRVSRESDKQIIDDNWFGTTFIKDTLDKKHLGFDQKSWSEEVRFTNFKSFASNVEGSSVSHYSKIKTLTGYSGAFSDMVMIDTYQSFANSTDETSLPTTTIFQKNNAGDGFSCIETSLSTSFSNISTDNALTKISSSEKKWVVSIYLSYLFAYDNGAGGTSDKVSYAFNKDGFPSATSGNVDLSGIKISNNAMQEEIQSMIYYFLHPTEGISYVSTWFKNKVSGILVGWHEDMVGNSSGVSTTGATKYLGFSGYVTLPTLSDISWTAWLLDEYNNIVVYLIILIFVILISYCIVGSMTFQRAIFGTLLFMVVALLPPLAINGTVNIINNSCDSIYGEKFTYWALVQHQTYLNDLLSASTADNKSDYLKVIFNQQSDGNQSDYTTVKMKWMAPKKDNVLSNVISEANKTSSSNSLSLMKNVLSSSVSGESFSDYDDALYLYRDYADIYMYQSIAYRSDVNSIAPLIGYNPAYLQDSGARDISYSSGKSMYSIYSKIDDTANETSLAFAQASGFLTDTSTNLGSNKSFGYLLDSAVGTSLIEQKLRFKSDLNINYNDLASSTFGIANEDYNLTVANLQTGLDTEGDALSTTNDDDQKSLGYFYYGLYTESPFYFFTWNLYDQSNSSTYNCGITENSTKSLLDLYTVDNQSYFYNYDEDAGNGYGELKDFCNMRSLFYYVIPYLRSANEVVLDWDEIYGLYTYEDVRLEYEEDEETVKIPNFNAVDAQGNPQYSDEYIYKWWHNYNVERLFNVYTPWVDTLYDCNYAKSETISILGEKFLVTDPLDPTSYYETDASGNITDGRMMVFSRSEMKYYGLTMKDLTSVEQKIIGVQDSVYKDLLQLMDYATFNDDVLVNAAGMLTTFAFNKEFSQSNVVGTNYTLYPQSYELKTFSYDAYLRLILAQSTGEDIMDTTNSTSTTESSVEHKSYYQRIVENSSITTGIGLIILDVIAVYAIPALKLFFLIALFFMSVLMIIAAAIKLEMNIVRTAWQSLISPLLKYGAISIGLAWIVSLFMFEGNTAVTERGGNAISLGDPVMVVLVMIVINLVVLILYYKVCKKCFKEMVSFAQAVGTSIGGAVAGTIGKVAGGFIGGKQISDSVARGTAKARGTSNQPQATTSSGSGGFGSKTGSFASGAFLGKTASDVANSSATSTKSNAKMNKYNEKSTKAEAKLNNLGKNVGAKKDEGKAEYLKKSHASDVESIKRERELLHQSSKNSTIIGKTSNFVKDKKLAVTSGYHKVAGGVEGGFYSARGAVKKGVGSATNSVRNSGVGKALKMDNTSRMKRYEANRDRNLEKAIRVEARSNRKQFAKGKDKK